MLYNKAPLFLWSVSYFVSLCVIGSNLSYLLASLCFFLILYILLRDIKQTMFFMFIINIPFARGKLIEFVIISKNEIPFGLFDVGYYFPLYISTVFLVGTLFLIFRDKSNLWKIANVRIVLIGFCFFLIACCIPLFYTKFPFVIGLSVIQLMLMGCVYTLPFWLYLTRSALSRINHILAAFIVFEAGWIMTQALHRGPLGRYLEAILPLNRTGILSTEDAGFMRYNGTFYEPSILGTFMLMHVFFFIYLLIQNRYRTQAERNIYIFAAVSAMTSIIFTGSRGIYFLFILLSIYLFRTRIIFRVKKFTTTTTPRAFLLSIIAVLLFFSPYYVTRLQTVPALVSFLFSGQGSGAYRAQLDTLAYRLAEVNPFGIGLNLSPYYFVIGFPQDRTVDPAHPHNIFFQLLAETGGIGLTAFLLFLWLIYRKYMIRRSSSAEPYFMASVIFIFCAQLYPIFISQPEILTFFFLHAGLMNWSLHQPNHE